MDFLLNYEASLQSCIYTTLQSWLFMKIGGAKTCRDGPLEGCSLFSLAIPVFLVAEGFPSLPQSS
jgi:hypothetical protein